MVVGGMYVRDAQNKGKEEGQTHESLRARAAHAADAAGDAEAVDWKEAGGTGRGGREREGGKGVSETRRPRGGRAARPHSRCPPFLPSPPNPAGGSRSG